MGFGQPECTLTMLVPHMPTIDKVEPNEGVRYNNLPHYCLLFANATPR